MERTVSAARREEGGVRDLDPASTAAVMLAVTCTAVALACDLLRAGDASGPLAMASHHLAFARTVACAALVPLGWRRTEPADRSLLLGLLGLAVVADFLILVCGLLVPGIAIFLVVQVGLTARHLRGLRVASAESRRAIKRIALGTAVAWAVVLSLLVRPVSQAGLLVPVAVYSLALSASLAAALSAPWIGHFDRRSAARIATGMVLFVLCDVSVATGAAFAGRSVGIVADAVTGIFYTPALLLLALSMKRPPRP